MKLTIHHKDTIVVYDEQTNDKNQLTTIRYSDQAERILDLIKAISKEVQELNK